MLHDLNYQLVQLMIVTLKELIETNTIKNRGLTK